MNPDPRPILRSLVVVELEMHAVDLPGRSAAEARAYLAGVTVPQLKAVLQWLEEEAGGRRGGAGTPSRWWPQACGKKRQRYRPHPTADAARHRRRPHLRCEVDAAHHPEDRRRTAQAGRRSLCQHRRQAAQAAQLQARVNHKRLSRTQDPDRDAQFAYIAEQRAAFVAQGLPLVSVDTKKKELVGNFRNSGRAWNQRPVPVNAHDFRFDAIGIANPYGVYDLQANLGSLFVGTSHDTPAFAADNLARWWVYDGRRRYPGATQLLVLADGGGSNGFRSRAWKHALQESLCDRQGLTVTVCHYPTSASKWNPIEHRMFSEISENWAGQPLVSYETILNYARTTRTATGLRVKA